MSRSLRTTIKKEVQASVGYGFGENRGMTLTAYIVDGGMQWVEICRQPTENTNGQTITLRKDALEIIRILAPAMVDFLQEVEKEVGKVR